MTTKQYFLCAVRDIDCEFGEGYAKAHPELLAAVLEVAAADYALQFKLSHSKNKSNIPFKFSRWRLIA
jgi:hypothetical protein